MILALAKESDPETLVGAVQLTADIKAALVASGYNPSDYNRLMWPIVGASRHAHGLILFSSDNVSALQDYIEDEEPDMLLIAAALNETLLQAPVRMLNPKPLLIRGAATNPKLYAVPIVDKRFYLSDAVGRDFNLWADAPASFIAASIDAGMSRRTYAQIIDALATILSARGVSLSSTASNSMTSQAGPYDLACRSSRAALILDRVLSEAGQVFVARPTTSSPYSTQNNDNKSSTDVINDVAASILHGWAEYYSTNPASGASNAPNVIWTRTVIPGSVTVGFTVWEASQNWRPDIKLVSVSTASIGPWSARSTLVSALFHDTHPSLLVGPSTFLNNTEINARAGALATAYMSRFFAGGLDIICSGVVQPAQAAAAIKWIEWIFDAEFGYCTRLRSDVNDPIMGYLEPQPDVDTDRQFTRAHTWGDVVRSELRVLSRGKIVSASASTGVASSITYTVKTSDSGKEIQQAGLTPSNRPLEPVQVTAAIAGSDCIVAIGPFAADGSRTISLVSCGERLNPAQCQTSGGRAITDPVFMQAIVTNRWGRVWRDRRGHPIQKVHNGDPITSDDERLQIDAMLTTRNGPLVSREGPALFGRHDAANNYAIDDALGHILTNRWRRVIVSREGNVLESNPSL